MPANPPSPKGVHSSPHSPKGSPSDNATSLVSDAYNDSDEEVQACGLQHVREVNTEALPPGWVPVASETANGRLTYFWNTATNKVQWERPTGPASGETCDTGEQAPPSPGKRKAEGSPKARASPTVRMSPTASEVDEDDEDDDQAQPEVNLRASSMQTLAEPGTRHRVTHLFESDLAVTTSENGEEESVNLISYLGRVDSIIMTAVKCLQIVYNEEAEEADLVEHLLDETSMAWNKLRKWGTYKKASKGCLVPDLIGNDQEKVMKAGVQAYVRETNRANAGRGVTADFSKAAEKMFQTWSTFDQERYSAKAAAFSDKTTVTTFIRTQLKKFETAVKRSEGDRNKAVTFINKFEPAFRHYVSKRNNRMKAMVDTMWKERGYGEN